MTVSVVLLLLVITDDLTFNTAEPVRFWDMIFDCRRQLDVLSTIDHRDFVYKLVVRSTSN
jgi:hypothetical protein